MFVWDTVYNNIIGFLFVLCRTTGIFTFNPIFSRNNVPNNIKAFMSVVFAVVMMSSMGVGAAVPEFNGIIGFAGIIIRELFIGLVLGFFTNLIITVILYAGEVMDTEIGLGMAKAYDPATGVTMPVFGNYFYYLFVLYFFLTNGHLSYIKLFSISYDTIPIGYEFTVNTLNLAHVIVLYMGTVMELAIKFAMPVLAVELIVEFCVGIIMKAVPTIQIFVLNVHIKLMMGFLVILAAARPLSEFVESLFAILWENLDTAVNNFF
ncbi:MAG: flagellar biosynthetic protein FliR [Ruminiclostridium sp.]|nr:flagellar biosynthetic protein FliR [Ruminiclostridium sp.]